MGENIVTTPAEQASERAIIEAATPGPWEVDATKALGAYGVYHGLSTDRPSRVCSMLPCELPRDRRDANAAFIAAARTGWPKALDERDAAIARAERAEARLAEFRGLIRSALGVPSNPGWCDEDFTRAIATLRAVIANDCENEQWARAEAAKVLGKWAEGDSYGVPSVADLAERMAEEITRLRAALESKKESMDARNLHDPAR
jgi:uncharacterized small protein (DUF1192 family)